MKEIFKLYLKSFIKIYLPLSILVAFSSEIHFYPLNSMLRISFGIIIINIIGLIREDINQIPLILLSGFVIFIERLMTNILFLDVHYEIAFLNGIPSLGYYLIFALLFKLSKVYEDREAFLKIFCLLALIDISSNCFEAIIRGDLTSHTFMVVLLVGLVRSFAAYIIYFTWRKKELFIIRQEHQKRYSQLNMLVANVESELFYLKKSSGDIEAVMSKCYELYDNAPQDYENKVALLDISKDIHEIKKDYIRVLNGFQDFVDNIQDMEVLNISEIFDIIKTNYNKSKKGFSQKLQFIYEQDGNSVLENYLSIFTILNNLIDNSIAACKDGGTIHISYKEQDEVHQFAVIDNGTGMSENVKALIFNPGFTMKYDNQTGKSSTGIGLTHVKNTLDNLNGSISVESIEGVGTKFIIYIPKSRKKATYE